MAIQICACVNMVGLRQGTDKSTGPAQVNSPGIGIITADDGVQCNVSAPAYLPRGGG